MDKQDANPEKVKQELTEHGLVVEEWGGETIAVPVSALKKRVFRATGNDPVGCRNAGSKANPNRLARVPLLRHSWTGAEARLLQYWYKRHLKVSDSIVAGTTYGRVRAMVDDKGRRIKRPVRPPQWRYWV